MTVNLNGVVRMMGILLIVLACCFLPSLVVAIIYKESVSFWSFMLTGISCAVIGFILKKLTRPSLALKARDGYLIAALGWMLASLVGAVPFVISGAIPSYVDAFFETCSGFSTTGSTILADIEPLPPFHAVLAIFHPLDRRYGHYRLHGRCTAFDGYQRSARCQRGNAWSYTG